MPCQNFFKKKIRVRPIIFFGKFELKNNNSSFFCTFLAAKHNLKTQNHEPTPHSPNNRRRKSKFDPLPRSPNHKPHNPAHTNLTAHRKSHARNTFQSR